MDRRSFLQLALAVPMVGQGRRGTQSGRDASPRLNHRRRRNPPASPGRSGGGPHRNFQTDATGIKDVWPATGPRVVWKRALGEGYSAPVVESGVLYTMYGKAGQEVVLAANAETGQTLWEHVTPMTFQSDAPEQGNGPYSVAADRRRSALHDRRRRPPAGLDKKTGKLLWTQQLWSDHRGSQLMYGYASSPIAFRDSVVVPVGGQGPGGDGVPAGRRHDRLVAERFRQRLLVADPDRRRRPRAARRR